MARSRTATNAVVLIVFAAVCIGAMEWFAFNVGQNFRFGLPDSSYRLSASFTDADGLPTAADVRVAGLVVGKVTDVGPDASVPGRTRVDMSITDTGVVVHANASAKVRPKTLLGEKYVDLDPGTSASPAVASGARLLDTSTAVAPDTIFNAFDQQTRAQEKVVIQELAQGVSGREGDVQAILPQLDAVVRDLAPVAQTYEKDSPLLDQILGNLQTVLQAVADEHTQLAGFLSNGSVALGAIANRDSSLIATLQQVSQFHQRLTGVVDATVPADRTSIERASPALDSQHAFIASVISPQPACGNKPCGILQILNGTFLGHVNYPDDQLNITSGTQPCVPGQPPTQNRCEGETVANEWASMFSRPADSVRSGVPTNRSALNISLSEGCDTVQETLSPLTGTNAQLNNLLAQLCKVISKNQATATTAAGPAPGGTATVTSGPAPGGTATEAATQGVIGGLEAMWS
ncbi:MAG TPA: MlaD family protein [Candidatus Dormibacteraeota bacterium]|nr:MlaD family protein [Candidatus Dormibacteraeota bacterium]